MTLSLYILRRFLRSFTGALCSLALLIALLDGFEQTREYSGEGASFADIAALTLLRLPELLQQALPIIFLVASLWLFIGLARSSELVIIRAAGLSGVRTMGLVAGLALLIGGFLTLILDPLAAVTGPAEDRILERYGETPTSRITLAGGAIWLRQQDNGESAIISARRIAPSGDLLTDAIFYRYDADGRLRDRISADQAQLTDEGWLLQNGRIWPMDRPESNPAAIAEDFTEALVPTPLSAADILGSFATPGAIPLWELPGVIDRLESSGLSATAWRVHFQSLLARPILMAAMVMIGSAFAMRHVRFGGVGLRVTMALLAGFVLYILQDISRSFGIAGNLPVGVAAWTPPIAAILLAFSLLLHLEDG
ncbi:LPS export ABC transporter permease LptG [Paracoccaceae bacterium GXU_MW_L88]